MSNHHHHHEKAPFLAAALLFLITILTGLGTFTSYWGVSTIGSNVQEHTGIYNWGKSYGNDYFKASPSWLQCVVVCQLIAFSLQLLYILLIIPSIIFRRLLPIHAINALLSFIIFVLLTISIIVFAVGWSWGVVLAADILALFLLAITGGAVGYGGYSEYR